MAFHDLKVQITKVSGQCRRSKKGMKFYVKDGKLELPPGENICIFALGSILQPISSACVRTNDGSGILDTVDEFQCPESDGGVVFKIEKVQDMH